MLIITLVGWYVLYRPVRRFVAYEFRKYAVSATFIAALSIEFWITRDFFSIIVAKFF